MPSAETDTSLLGALATGASHRALDAEAWERVASQARVERLAPMIYWKQRHDPSLPRAVADRLRAELYRTAAVNHILFRELATFLSATRERGLSAPVVLKGAALAFGLYDDIALRPMGDVDLLVPREEVDRFVALAEELGYQRTSPEMAHGLVSGLRYHVALERGPEATAKLELHWQLVAGDADTRSPDIRWFHDRTEPWPPGADPVGSSTAALSALSLRPGALLLHLSAHAVLQHGLGSTPMIWLHDIHLVLTRQGGSIDWGELVLEARRLGWDEALEVALYHAQALFGTEIPERATQELTRAPAAHTVRVSGPSDSRAEWLWRELGFVRFPERLRLVAAILFPRPAYLKWRYPNVGWLWPACYAYRWYVVASEAARALSRRAGLGRRIHRVDKRG